MANKVRVTALFLVLAILIATFGAVSVVQAKTVGAVEKLEVTEEGGQTDCTLRWHRVKGADGYQIFQSVSDKKDFDKVKTVEGKKNTRVQLTDLTPATVYRYKVRAYKIHRDKEYTGDFSPEMTAYTLPGAPKVEASSLSEGSMNLRWSTDTGAAGYQLQYAKDKDFSADGAQTMDFKAGQNSAVLEKLTEKATYYVRMRGSMAVGSSTKYGPWSEVKRIQIAETVKLPANIDKDKPMVALTFDDGPAFDGSTGRILDVLEKYGARATFFMVGTRINDNTKKYLKRELELGCELGNHTYNHDHYGKAVTEADVVKCSDAVYKACGKRPTAFRCPGGNMSGVMQNTAKKEGMIIAYWSVDTEDWKSRNPAQIISQAEHGAYDGSIILMHDIYGSTADAVEKIVPALVKKGYQIVTVSEMIQAKTGKAPQAGQQYIDYKTINNNTH